MFQINVGAQKKSTKVSLGRNLLVLTFLLILNNYIFVVLILVVIADKGFSDCCYLRQEFYWLLRQSWRNHHLLDVQWSSKPNNSHSLLANCMFYVCRCGHNQNSCGREDILENKTSHSGPPCWEVNTNSY